MLRRELLATLRFARETLACTNYKRRATMGKSRKLSRPRSGTCSSFQGPRLLMPGPAADGSSEITSAVAVNRILERMPDYNPKGGSLSCASAPAPPRRADHPPQVKCDLPLSSPPSAPPPGYGTHKSSCVPPRRRVSQNTKIANTSSRKCGATVRAYGTGRGLKATRARVA